TSLGAPRALRGIDFLFSLLPTFELQVVCSAELQRGVRGRLALEPSEKHSNNRAPQVQLKMIN
ncbi:Nitrogen regulatory protein P-II 1, partial [Dissostichus eleginoides]